MEPGRGAAAGAMGATRQSEWRWTPLPSLSGLDWNRPPWSALVLAGLCPACVTAAPLGRSEPLRKETLMMTRCSLCVVYRRSRTESLNEEADFHLPHKQVIHANPGWWRVHKPQVQVLGGVPSRLLSYCC